MKFVQLTLETGAPILINVALVAEMVRVDDDSVTRLLYAHCNAVGEQVETLVKEPLSVIMARIEAPGDHYA